VRFVLPRTAVGEAGRASGLLASRAADLELTTHRLTGADLEWQRFAIEPLLLAVPTSHPLAHNELASLSDVRDERFVLRRAPSGMRGQVLDLCTAAGFEPEVAFEVDDRRARGVGRAVDGAGRAGYGRRGAPPAADRRGGSPGDRVGLAHRSGPIALRGGVPSFRARPGRGRVNRTASLVVVGRLMT
jgi:hypothetical protein